MNTAHQNLFTRDDTFLGICQGLGEDLGLNPDLFRVAMIPALFFFPIHTLAAYLGAGVLVLFTRLVFPVQPRARVQREDCAAIVEQHEESPQAGQRLAEPTDDAAFTPASAPEALAA